MSYNGESWHDAKPVRNKDAAKSIPNLLSVEERILECDEMIDEVISHYGDAVKNLARAEVAWKKHKAHVVYRIAFGGEKSAEDARESAAMEKKNADGVPGSKLYSNYKGAEAVEKELATRLRGLQTKMSGLQSLARGLRAATGV